MAKKKSKKSKDVPKKRKGKVILLLLILIVGFIVGVYFYINTTETSLVLKQYFEYLNKKEYEAMYDLVETSLSKEEFINRVKNIYEGIEAENISIQVATNSKDEFGNETKITYNNSMKTLAGNINFINTAKIKRKDNTYVIEWDSSIIFPDLDNDSKVRVKNLEASRGAIYDRNGIAIAKEGSIYNIGLVPGKMDDTTNINRISELTGVSVETINNNLNSSYVKEDTFVPIRKMSKEEQEKKNELLKIKGIMINDTNARVYPYKEATSILTGYVQEKEGKSGLEYSYNDRLKGRDGIEIYIDKNGENIKTIAKKDLKDGQDVKLTIDIETQSQIYEEFKDDEGAHVAINYKTGEILALVSTPSYDANDFSVGITEEEWNNLQNDEKKPMYNRCLGAYVPGSSIKPIIGAIGLMSNSFTASESFGVSTDKWQKDESWKDLFITTTETYSGDMNLENALIYSDNIYFAQSALKIGKDVLQTWLQNFGFNETLEFPQEISKSTYGNMDSEASIANSGYGQAEMLVNPILTASMYSSFANGGDMVKPYLKYEDDENNRIKYFKQNVISFDVANTIKQGLIQVVEKGTGVECKIEGKTIAGKTGTAEIKENQQDKNGPEIGWFNSFDDNNKLIIDMVQNVKGKGGSHYVVKKARRLWEK